MVCYGGDSILTRIYTYILCVSVYYSPFGNGSKNLSPSLTSGQTELIILVGECKFGEGRERKGDKTFEERVRVAKRE